MCWSLLATTLGYFEGGEQPVLLVVCEKLRQLSKGLVGESLTVEIKASCGIINKAVVHW